MTPDPLEGGGGWGDLTLNLRSRGCFFFFFFFYSAITCGELAFSKSKDLFQDVYLSCYFNFCKGQTLQSDLMRFPIY